MFVTNWISTTKIQKISEITNFFRHYFLSRTEVYNCMVPLDFYQKNEFLFLFSTEQQEAENLGYDMTKSLHTRLMYYDLKKLTSN